MSSWVSIASSEDNTIFSFGKTFQGESTWFNMIVSHKDKLFLIDFAKSVSPVASVDFSRDILGVSTRITFDPT